jgi:hypothetical protein
MEKMRNTYRVLARNLGMKLHLGISRGRWKDIIKMDIKEIE